MSGIAINVEGLGKRYRIGTRRKYKTLRDAVTQAVAAPLRGVGRIISGGRGGTDSGADTIWALKDVSFEVRQGEVVGVIGRNGAGKSTLLKILSRITEPTEGRAEIRGRVGSLLEVGTGFHPELTGRENIFLNGAILGMGHAEIKGKFEEIVEFAEVAKFIDTPVKHFSSGMYIRLAFSVAAHLEPEILLVDEVLAVGDTAFQKKCLGKMKDVSATGRTVLFVSHNMMAVRNLCERAMLLEHGQTACLDSTATVIERYVGSGTPEGNGEVTWESPDDAPGNHEVRLRAVRVVAGSETTPSPSIDDDIEIQIEYLNLVEGGRRMVSAWLVDAADCPVFTSGNLRSISLGYDPWVDREYPVGLFRTSFTIPKHLLNPGVHRVHLFLNRKGASDSIIKQKDVISFKVEDSARFRTEFYGKWVGAVRPLLHWETVFLGTDQ